MKKNRLCIIIAGGGTGGHLYPAIAIAEEIRRRDPESEITFIGTKGKIEERVVPAYGFGFRTIWISGFVRRLSFDAALFPLKVVVALMQSLFLIYRHRPAVVIGTGGYVCGPPLIVASLLGIPTLIQEQNCYPGVTTRMLALRATEVHIMFDRSRRYLRRQDNVRLSGNPTRAVIGTVRREDAETFFGISPGRNTMLIVGGSQGARGINDAVMEIYTGIVATGLQVLWQTGERDYQRVEAFLHTGHLRESVRLFKFIEKMEYAYAAAHLALCRSGASTLAELMCTGTPAILIPLPTAAADHQTENAKAMAEAGAAIVWKEGDDRGKLLAAIVDLVNTPSRLHEMAGKARALGKPGASAELADAVVRLAERRHGR